MIKGIKVADKQLAEVKLKKMGASQNVARSLEIHFQATSSLVIASQKVEFAHSFSYNSLVNMT